MIPVKVKVLSCMFFNGCVLFTLDYYYYTELCLNTESCEVDVSLVHPSH